MKKALAFLFTCFVATTSFSQSLPDYEAIPLKAKEDYNATANDAALQAANYVLSVPLEKDNINRLKSLRYLINWMEGTPEYTFTLGGSMMKYTKKNEDLFGTYVAALVKSALENPAIAKDDAQMNLSALKLLAIYAKNPANHVKMNGDLKKLIAAEESNSLETLLKG